MDFSGSVWALLLSDLEAAPLPPRPRLQSSLSCCLGELLAWQEPRRSGECGRLSVPGKSLSSCPGSGLMALPALSSRPLQQLVTKEGSFSPTFFRQPGTSLDYLRLPGVPSAANGWCQFPFPVFNYFVGPVFLYLLTGRPGDVGVIEKGRPGFKNGAAGCLWWKADRETA